MQDKDVSISWALAIALWTIGTMLVLWDLLAPVPVGNLGVVIVTAATVLNIRAYFGDMHEYMRNAFELGRDYERARERSGVRSLR